MDFESLRAGDVSGTSWHLAGWFVFAVFGCGFGA